MLSDPQKRKIFDQFGSEGLRAGGGGGNGGGGGFSGFPGGFPGGGGGGGSGFHFSDPNELFSRMFGGGAGGAFSSPFGDLGGMGGNPFGASMFSGMGGGGGGQNGMFGPMGGMGGMGGRAAAGGGGMGGPAKRHSSAAQSSKRHATEAEVVQRPLPVTLEDLFTGTKKKLKINRRVLQDADGSVRQEHEVVEIDVKPGWKAGTKITFAGKGDRVISGAPAQTIQFVLEEKPHARFTRSGNDLTETVRVSLRQALSGIDKSTVGIDGQTIRIQLPSATPQTVKRLVGHGMPKKGGGRGDLNIRFDINFPALRQEDRAKIDAILATYK